MLKTAKLSRWSNDNHFQIICANASLYSDLASKRIANERFYSKEGNFKISEEVSPDFTLVHKLVPRIIFKSKKVLKQPCNTKPLDLKALENLAYTNSCFYLGEVSF